MKKGMQLVILGYIRLYVLMVVIYCYLERKNYKVLNFMISVMSLILKEVLSSFEFRLQNLNSSKLNKHRDSN